MFAEPAHARPTLRSICILAFAIAFCLSAIAVSPIAVQAQGTERDSLERLLTESREDSTRISLLLTLAGNLRSTDPDAALAYAYTALELGEQQRDNTSLAEAHSAVASVYWLRGNFPKALTHYRAGLDYAGRVRDSSSIAFFLINIGNIYWSQLDTAEAMQHYRRGRDIARRQKDVTNEARAVGNLAILMKHRKQYAGALENFNRAVELFRLSGDDRNIARAYNNIGNVYNDMGDAENALTFYERSLATYSSLRDNSGIANTECNIGEMYRTQGKSDLAVQHFQRSLALAVRLGGKDIEKDALLGLSRCYADLGRYTKAYRYQTRYTTLKDSLFSIERMRQINELNTRNEMMLLEKEREVEASLKEKAETQRNALLIGVGLVLILVIVIYRGYRYRKHTSENLARAYSDLQRTQKQLIHAEKMATLGELTAGVAHEIKNPLNFISNFSSINDELIRELRRGIPKNREEMDEILDTVIENNTKLSDHSRRADGIVNSMLMHSRESKGIRQSVEINNIVRDAVELAMHGVPSAKEVDMRFDLGHNVGNINVVSAEISRVVLNLVGNAVYAAHKRYETSGGQEPHVTVSTARETDSIKIWVSDNGVGMSEEVREKIFQPFFTTKPTGDGTGLGLSLCWDIVVNGHNGTIDVESREGTGATFTVTLPVED